MENNIKEIVYKKIKKLTKNKFDDKSNIYEIGIDSLDLVELVTDLEDYFKIKVSDEQLLNIKKVSDIETSIKKAKK